MERSILPLGKVCSRCIYIYVFRSIRMTLEVYFGKINFSSGQGVLSLYIYVFRFVYISVCWNAYFIEYLLDAKLQHGHIEGLKMKLCMIFSYIYWNAYFTLLCISLDPKLQHWM